MQPKCSYMFSSLYYTECILLKLVNSVQVITSIIPDVAHMKTVEYDSCSINHNSCLHILLHVDFIPLRLRKLKERKKPPFPPVGVFGPSSPRSCANSVPGRSMRRVVLLSTSSRKMSGFSWRSFSTKKSGLKMTGGRPARQPPGESSRLVTILHTLPLKGCRGILWFPIVLND